jgi:hypothetical protein
MPGSCASAAGGSLVIVGGAFRAGLGALAEGVSSVSASIGGGATRDDPRCRTCRRHGASPDSESENEPALLAVNPRVRKIDGRANATEYFVQYSRADRLQSEGRNKNVSKS